MLYWVMFTGRPKSAEKDRFNWNLESLIPDRPINLALASLPVCLDAIIKDNGSIGNV